MRLLFAVISMFVRLRASFSAVSVCCLLALLGPVTASYAQVPTAPTGLTATAGNGKVSLSWTASTGATAYNVYRSTTTGTETLYNSPSGTATTYLDTAASNGTHYYYKVTALNGSGESVKSSEANTTPQLSAPTGLTASGSGYTINLAWTAVTNATSYNV